MRLKKRILAAIDTLRKLIEQDDREIETIEKNIECGSEPPYVEDWQTRCGKLLASGKSTANMRLIF